MSFKFKWKFALCFFTIMLFLTGCSKENSSSELNNSAVSASKALTESSSPENIISLEEAEDSAFSHAGVDKSEAKIVKAELDYDNGKAEYEIEFTAPKYKYDYDINALDGSVLKFSKKEIADEFSETAFTTISEAVNTAEAAQTAEESQLNKTQTEKVTSGDHNGKITAEDAKSKALKHAGLTASEVTFTKAELDYDEGIAEYEIEFYSSEYEYDYEINADNGMVIKYSKEALEFPVIKNSGKMITLKKAKDIALQYSGAVASEATFTKAELDYDDGIAEYEIEFYVGQKEYEFKIDAYSGEILEFDTD